MKKDRRWMKSVLAAAAEPPVALPWARASRPRRAAKAAAPAAGKPRAMAAR